LWTDDGTTQEKYIYAHATIWAEVRTTDGKSATYYHHTDHTGTTECITDTLGKVVWEASYEAYGKLVHENGTVSFKASFTGKQIDEDTGLYYFNARWYVMQSWEDLCLKTRRGTERTGMSTAKIIR
jgi:uncharacterized protein RhaS with RHS repeats